MAKRLAIPSEDVKLRIVGAFDSFDVSRVQRLNITTDIPSTDIYELGNNTLAGTVTDIPNVTLTFSIFDVGIKAFAVLTGKDPDAYPAAGVDISDLGEVDVIVFIKSATVTDYVKSAHAKRLQIRDFSFNYSVEGESTEDYTLIGSEKRWFKNDVYVDRFTSPGTSATLSETPIQLKNGNYLLSVIADGEYLTEVASADEAGEYEISGTSLTLGAAYTSTLIVVYHANPAGNNWSYIGDASMPAAVRGKDVPIEISANSISRVQSVTINGNLNVQAVREMGNTVIVGYQRQVPTVDGNLSVLDTDTELLDLLLNGSINSGDTEFQLGEECVASGVDLVIKILDPCDRDTTLKSIKIPTLVLTGDNYTSNVNQNATMTLNFKSNTAECVVYSGAVPA